MKRLSLFLLFLAFFVASKPICAQYVLQTGHSCRHLSASTMHNALFVGNNGSDQCWVMFAGSSQQARVYKGKYALVVIDSTLEEKRRLPFQNARGTSVLGAAMTDGVAEMLALDQSVDGRTLFLHHDVNSNAVAKGNAAVSTDTLFTLDYGRHDTCKVWVAQSESGRRTAVLTVVQYVGQKKYSAIATLYDEHLRPLWSHDVETGSVGTIAVSNEGSILAFAHTVKNLTTSFSFTVIDSLGSHTKRVEQSGIAVGQALLAGFEGGRALVLGLYLDVPGKDFSRYSSGRLAMSFDASAMQILSIIGSPYSKEDICTLKNMPVKRFDADSVLVDVKVLDVVRTHYGAVMQTACVETSNREDDEGNPVSRHTLKGVNLMGVDNNAHIVWQTNIAAHEQRIGDAMNLGGLMFTLGNNLILIKNEHRRTAASFDGQTDAKLVRYDKKNTLSLYKVSPQGMVEKQILQRKIRFAPLLAFNHKGGSVSLLFEEKGNVVPGKLLFAGNNCP